MLKLIGIACATGSIAFDLLSYYRQIHKTLKTKHSSQVSSTAYLFKLSHYTCSIIALVIFYNWVGLCMELSAALACLVCLFLVIKYKPKNWHLVDFKFGK
jgi:uncharacterized protein with PQ loop repeat